MARVNVLYHHFPHYRRPVMTALNNSEKHEYRFFGGHEDMAGIKAFNGNDNVKVVPIGFTAAEDGGKMKMFDFDRAFDDCDVLIVIGNPNIFATWWIPLRARMMGIKVMFWAHGWLRPEAKLKSLVRNIFFRLADRVLVYGERAIILAEKSGFPSDRISVIYNSLDFPEQDKIYKSLDDTSVANLRSSLSLPTERPVLLSVSRLTEISKYDWLIKAVKETPLEECEPVLVFVGDGPVRNDLETLARDLEVNAIFLGSIYDEGVVGKYIMAADAVVSPGKVGLTAMHALAFGTPIVTHGDLDAQMPEVEAVQAGVSGEFFKFGDIEGLAQAISRVLNMDGTIENRRAACRSVILKKYTPTMQRQLIDEAVDALL